MTLRFLPLGLPESSSFAVSSSAALTVGDLPLTASLAEYSLGNIGPAGAPYNTVTGNIATI